MEPSGERSREDPPSAGGGSGERSAWGRVLGRLNVITKHPVVSTVIAAGVVALGGLAWSWAFGGDADGGDGSGGTSQPSQSSEPSESTGGPVLAAFDLKVEVDPDEVAAQPGEPYFYWLPEDVRGLDAPPERCRDRRDWAYGAGGADADVVWAKLTVENNRDRQVTIDDLRVEVVEDAPTLGGSVAACPLGGASSEPFGLFVDLSQEPPAVQFRENQGEEFGAVPVFELAPGDQDSFMIYVWGRPGHLVSWRLVADVRSGGETTDLILDDGGDPMRIAGTAELPMFTWSGGGWERYRP